MGRKKISITRITDERNRQVNDLDRDLFPSPDCEKSSIRSNDAPLLMVVAVVMEEAAAVWSDGRDSNFIAKFANKA